MVSMLGPSWTDEFWLVVVVALFTLFIWALVDVWKSGATQERKLLWTLLVVLTNPIGAIIWFAVGKRSNK